MFCRSLPILGTRQKNIKDSTWFNYIFPVSIGYITMFIEVPPAKHGSLPPPDGQLLEDKGFDLGPFDPPFFICENLMKLGNITIRMPIWMMKTRGKWMNMIILQISRYIYPFKKKHFGTYPCHESRWSIDPKTLVTEIWCPPSLRQPPWSQRVFSIESGPLQSIWW